MEVNTVNDSGSNHSEENFAISASETAVVATAAFVGLSTASLPGKPLGPETQRRMEVPIRPFISKRMYTVSGVRLYQACCKVYEFENWVMRSLEWLTARSRARFSSSWEVAHHSGSTCCRSLGVDCNLRLRFPQCIFVSVAFS